MQKETITITIEYDKNEGRILVGNLILAKIYATKDGLSIGTIDRFDVDEAENKSK